MTVSDNSLLDVVGISNLNLRIDHPNEYFKNKQCVKFEIS